MKTKIRQFFSKYKHGWILLYFFVYLIWFAWLEQKVTDNYYSIHMELDDYIPFVEIFIIPYLLWFAFIATAIIYFGLTSRRDFIRLCIFLFVGMTISLIVCTIWPNGQDLRPDLTTLGRDNLFIRLVSFIYATDTPTNVCPSVHVLNSVGICIAVFQSNSLKDKKAVHFGALVLTVAICASTVLLKQHSIFDLFCALLLSLFLYWLAYLPKFERIPDRIPDVDTA